MMCRAVEKLYNDGIKIGEERGEKRGERRGEKRGEKRGIERNKKEVAKKMLGAGLPYKQIEQFTDLSPERIREIEAECKGK